MLLNNLLLAFQPLAVEAGTSVVERGDLKSEMYFVCRGELEAVGEAGEVLGRIGEGEFFGEMAVLFDRPRSATVRATRPCDLLVLEGGDFRRIIQDFPEADAEFRRLAAERQAARREA